MGVVLIVVGYFCICQMIWYDCHDTKREHLIYKRWLPK